jgi:cytochrome b6-f complex iron-sulfur subunit
MKNMEKNTMNRLNRRKLLSWFGLGWLVSLLPSSLVGCGEATNTPSASTSSVPASKAPAPAATTTAPESVAAAPSNNFKAIGTVAQLDEDKSLFSSDKKIAVVRDPKDSSKLLAVNSACTHKGCVVEWQKTNKEYVCPCHDAKFAADGKVLQGPAKTPLTVYVAKIENGKVLVRT